MYQSQIVTPLGVIGFELSIDGTPLYESPQEYSDSGEHIAQWAEHRGVRVTLRTIPLTNFAGIFASPDESHQIDRWWGVIARFDVVRASGPLEFRASLVDGPPGGWNTGQYLAAKEFSLDDAHAR